MINNIQFLSLKIFIFLFIGGLLSTVTEAQETKKKDRFTYFQSGALAEDSLLVKATPPPAFRIIPGTELSIVVASLDREADLLFNPSLANQRNTSDANKAVTGYEVDSKGNVDFPTVGKISLLNLTLEQVADTLKAKLRKHINNPFVTVRVVNFQVTVMGEVAQPSVFNIHKDKVTLPEVISMAGDMTIYGRRDNILIIQEVNGNRSFGRVSLQDRTMFSSTYFYLQPNDIVYIEPHRSKKILAGKVFPYLPTILSGLSLLAILSTNLLRR